MTAREAYEVLSTRLTNIYDDRESATIARYLVEDLFSKSFWSEDDLSTDELILLDVAAERLMRHEPWQYVGGFADFYGYKFKVNRSVLIPRPETEELVYLALDTIKRENITSILDIGTGSGIIPLTIAKKTEGLHIYALDISKPALEMAQENSKLLETDVAFLESDFLNRDLWPDLPKVDMVISNPPYITASEKEQMHPNVLQHEPHIALFVQFDAMEFYKAIASFVMEQQDFGCKVLVEINENYGTEVCDTFRTAGLKNIVLIKDLQGKNRIVVAEK
jgi:release factor glutamine methyltransferase